MAFQIGDVILTKIEKRDRFGDFDNIVIPKDSEGYVCETNCPGFVLIEFDKTEQHPACVIEYAENEVSLKEKTKDAL